MKRKILVTLALGLLMLGCSSPPPPATAVKWSDYNVQSNHEKQISLEGYVRLPVTTLVSDTMLLELYEHEDGKGKFLPFSVRIGSGANCVEKPPKDYKLTDLKLHANDGSLVGPSEKVRVEGKFIYSSTSCILFAPINVQKL